MSELQELIEALQETDAAAEYLSRSIQDRPEDEILQINASSVAKRRRDLVRRVDRVLNVRHDELVRYRIVRGPSLAYPAKAVASAMLRFQELVTSIFDALRTGPKQRYRPSLESAELSTFDFAGATSGSVIVSFTVQNDRMLFDDSELDRTFKLVEQVLSARESADLQLLAKEIGVASIAKAYAWAETNVSYDLDTSIEWGRSFESSTEFFISASEAEIIRSLIENKSDQNLEEVGIEAELLGFDGATSYFHIETPDRIDIRGKLSPTMSKQWTTGMRYRMKLSKSSQIRYATGEEKVDWTLLALEPLA